MLHNGNLRAQQNRMRGAMQISGIVDVVRVYADQHGARVPQVAGSVFGEERMSLEVLFGAPVTIPPCVHQYRVSTHIHRSKRRMADGTLGAACDPNEHSIEASKACQIKLGEVMSIGVAVEGAIEICTGIGDQLD